MRILEFQKFDLEDNPLTTRSILFRSEIFEIYRNNLNTRFECWIGDFMTNYNFDTEAISNENPSNIFYWTTNSLITRPGVDKERLNKHLHIKGLDETWNNFVVIKEGGTKIYIDSMMRCNFYINHYNDLKYFMHENVIYRL
jgi:hypothetical protein